MADEWVEIPHQKQAKAAQDEWQEIPVAKAEPETGTSPAQTALEGFGQTATMGYLPQIQAGVSTGIDKLQQLLGVGAGGEDAKLRAQGFNVPEQSYVKDRDANIARQAQQAEDNPVANFAGKAAGIGASMLAPIGVAARGTSLGARALAGAATGALQGAAYNPGDVAGEVNPVQAGDRLRNLLVGGAIGGAVPVAVDAAKGGANSLMKIALNIKKGRQVPADIGNQLVDQGLWGSRGGMTRQVNSKITSANDALENAVGQMHGEVPTDSVVDKLRTHAEKFFPQADGPVDSEFANVAGRYLDRADDMASRSSMSPKEMLAWKRLNGELGYGVRGVPGATDTAELAQLSGNAAKDALVKAAEKQSPDLANTINTSNEDMTALFKARDGLKHSTGLGNLVGKLGMSGAAAAGAGAIGGLPAAALAAIASTPMFQSVAAQALQKGIAPGIQKSAPFLQRSLFETMRKK